MMSRQRMSPPPFTRVAYGSIPWCHAAAHWNNSFYVRLIHHQVVEQRGEYIMGCLLIARFTVQEALRRRLFVTIAILSLVLLGLFSLLLYESTSRMQDFTNGQDMTLQILYEGIAITVLAMWLVY